MDACSRHEVASGAVDKRVLAVLAFLSRSGLEPTVGALRCSAREYASASSVLAVHPGEEMDISAINGTAIAGHQGPETITELTIRTLLTLPRQFVPHEIVSLMRFPGAPNTHANTADWNRIRLEFRPKAPAPSALDAAAAAHAAHSAGAGATAPAPIVTTGTLSAAQWDQPDGARRRAPDPDDRRQAELGRDPRPEAPLSDAGASRRAQAIRPAPPHRASRRRPPRGRRGTWLRRP